MNRAIVFFMIAIAACSYGTKRRQPTDATIETQAGPDADLRRVGLYTLTFLENHGTCKSSVVEIVTGSSFEIEVAADNEPGPKTYDETRVITPGCEQRLIGSWELTWTGFSDGALLMKMTCVPPGPVDLSCEHTFTMKFGRIF